MRYIWRRKFTVSEQMSELSRKTVSKLPVNCSKWLRQNYKVSGADDSVLDRRTNSLMVSANSRCRRPAAAEARIQSSAKYDGARPRRHLTL